jgi:hypothetical protein
MAHVRLYCYRSAYNGLDLYMFIYSCVFFTPKVEALHSSETLLPTYQITTAFRNTKLHNMKPHRSENLKLIVYLGSMII